VSHDRAFLDRICTGILHVRGDGTTERHAGNYAQFLANQAERAKIAKVAAANIVQRPAQAKSAAKGPQAVKLSWAEQQKLAGIEAEIEAVESAVATAEAHLGDPDVLRDPKALDAATKGLAAAVAARDGLYDEWQRLDAKQAAWNASR
jgi:ATP-binding cassette subfamily F protein uup